MRLHTNLQSGWLFYLTDRRIGVTHYAVVVYLSLTPVLEWEIPPNTVPCKGTTTLGNRQDAKGEKGGELQ
jgi:hypothetical protein